MRSKYPKFSKNENVKEVFLAEALGYASAGNVRLAAKKKVILSKGSRIGPETIGRLAEQGIDRVPVYRKPKVSILVVGAGLVTPGHPFVGEKTYDFSIAAIKAALASMRIHPVFVRRLETRMSLLKKVLPFAYNHSDIVILVLKEARKELKRYLAQAVPGKHRKILFCLPYDLEEMLERFYEDIQPVIQSFMGFKEPSAG